MSMESLQAAFVRTKGLPIERDGCLIAQMDRISIPSHALVTIQFVGDQRFVDNAAAIAVDRNSGGWIALSDGTRVHAVATWDDDALARQLTHEVYAPEFELRVYNKYRIRHSSGLITEDSFTGNAGIVVSEKNSDSRLYECSNGSGGFDKRNLVFRVSWRGM
jgi:hypothetical protein